MRSLTACALVLLLCGPATGVADNPQVTVNIVETDPVSPATLHNNDNVYVHVHYVSSAPVRIWIRPYWQGKSAGAMTDGSPLYPAGEGEAFGWFAFRDSGQVDSIHVQVAKADSGYPFMEESTPANFVWDGTPGASRQPAAWVLPFQQHEAAQQQQDYQNYMNQPLGAGGAAALVVFGVLVVVSLAACFLWPIWGVIRWRGKWRLLAAIPCGAICLWVLKDCADLAGDPTSHNLLPFEFIEAAVLIAPYMFFVWLLRRATLKKEKLADESDT